MTDRPTTDHTNHDRILIVAFAADDVDGNDRDRAERLVEACPDCGLLADDLRAIARATAELPRLARPRDFTVTPGEAERSRRRGWRRLLGVLAGPRFATTRPLAVGLTTLGVAGLLLASLPSVISLGGSAAAPAAGAPTESIALEHDTAGGPASNPVSHPASGETFGGAVQEPAASAGQPRAAGGEIERDLDDGDGRSNDAAPRDARAASPLVVLSGSFLIVGLGLFGLRWTARRFGD